MNVIQSIDAKNCLLNKFLLLNILIIERGIIWNKQNDIEGLFLSINKLSKRAL